MASSSTQIRSSSSVFIVLLVHFLLHFSQLGSAAAPMSFCSLTLSRPTCPDLPTYDAFDITTYGGRWFEIGSSANFKNLQESGGICVLANYTLIQAPSPGKGAVVGVVNTLYSVEGAPLHNISQVVISLSAAQICSQAFSICTQADVLTNSNSSLAQGFALVSNVTLACKDKQSISATTLTKAKDSLEESIAGINVALDCLSKAVSSIQVLNAQLGQGEGNATANVASLAATVAESNETTIAIVKAVASIEKQRKVIGTVAAALALTGDVADSSTLGKAAGLIVEGEGSITELVAEIQSSLASVVGASQLFLTPSFGLTGYNGRIVGTAVQNASFAGKLEVTFPSFPPGQYWVLAVEEEDGKGSNGYSAVLVYGCDENQGTGGIQETLFVLSRTPSLTADAVRRLLAKAEALGVTGVCSTPFIFTVQSQSCGNPPSDIPPSYY